MPGLSSGSEVDVPLKAGDEVLGVLVVESREPNAFGPEDLEILTAAAQHAGIALARIRLLEEQHRVVESERRRADERDALLATITDLSAELELSRLLEAVLSRAVTLLGAAGGELATFDAERNELVIAANHNMREDSRNARLKVGEGAMGHVVRTGEQMIIPDYQTWEGRSRKYARIDAHAVVVAPLLIGKRPVGAINVWHEDPSRSFSEADRRLLILFGQHAAIALENARRFTAGRRERQYFEVLVRNSPVAIVVLDVEHRVLTCNPAFEALDGYTRDEVAGKNLDDLITTPETRAEAVSYTVQAAAHPRVNADVLMPDLQRMGGPSEFMRAVALCQAWHQPVSSHLFTEASAHLLAAAPNALILEHMGWWQDLFSEPLRISEGCVVLSEKPGIGVELSQTALKRFKV